MCFFRIHSVHSGLYLFGLVGQGCFSSFCLKQPGWIHFALTKARVYYNYCRLCQENAWCVSVLLDNHFLFMVEFFFVFFLHWSVWRSFRLLHCFLLILPVEYWHFQKDICPKIDVFVLLHFGNRQFIFQSNATPVSCFDLLTYCNWTARGQEGIGYSVVTEKYLLWM